MLRGAGVSAFPNEAGERLSSPTFAGRETELDLLCGTLRALDCRRCACRRGPRADLGLTPRETEVLAQLACGRTDRQIGEDKLDAANRGEAAEIGQRVGLE